MNSSLMIAVMETRAQLQDRTFATVEEKLKAAMGLTKNHWFVTDEDGRFRAAIGAVLADAPPEDKERIEDELRALLRRVLDLLKSEGGTSG